MNLHNLHTSYCKERKWEKEEKGEKEVELKAIHVVWAFVSCGWSYWLPVESFMKR